MREVVDIAINPATLARFEALPDNSLGVRRRVWTPEEDAILVKYWPSKNKESVAKALGVDTNTARRHYRELTA